MRALYIEDEKFLAEAVKHNLEKASINVDLALTGEDGLNRATNGIYDIIVLDMVLPGISGLDILKRIRELKISTPVIILSALGEVEDKITGLDAGADDYLAKPFKTAELISRINAILRRPSKIAEEQLSFHDLKYDTYEKTLNGESLTVKESGIIEELLKNPGKTVKKEYLLNKIWGSDSYRDDNYLEVYISRLRKILRKIKSKVNIQSIRGLGYKLVEK